MAINLYNKQLIHPYAEPLDVKTVVDNVDDLPDAYEGLVFYDKSAQKVKVVKSVDSNGVPRCEEIGGFYTLPKAITNYRFVR
ncbi:MAG: hypothetical protein KBT12_00645 [Bacteroidales bacterium]|nr:hypothetical protein [Candidatus Physcousia equi]